GADAAVAGDRDLRIEDVEHGTDYAEAHRTDGELLLKLSVPLGEMRKPTRPARLEKLDPVLGFRRGPRDVVRHAAVPVDVRSEKDVERGAVVPVELDAVAGIVGEIAVAVDDVGRGHVEVRAGFRRVFGGAPVPRVRR